MLVLIRPMLWNCLSKTVQVMDCYWAANKLADLHTVQFSVLIRGNLDCLIYPALAATKSMSFEISLLTEKAGLLLLDGNDGEAAFSCEWRFPI